MHGGLTKGEFESLRSDLQHLVSDHPRAKFTFLLLDRDGLRTEELGSAVRYGITAYEDDKLVFEEMGRVVKGAMVKE
jgi:hypothetical protein